jgi:hypothetical protein
MFTTLHHLAPKLRMSRAVSLLPLYAFTTRIWKTIQVTKAVIFKASTINSVQYLCFSHLALWVLVIAHVITMRDHTALLSAGNL